MPLAPTYWRYPRPATSGAALRAGGMALAMALMLLLGTGCERRARPQAEAARDTTAGPTPVHVSWNARFRLSKSGTPRVSLQSEAMEQYDVGDSTYTRFVSPTDSQRVRAYIFDDTGDSSAVIVADEMTYLERRGAFQAFGDVVVTTTDARVLRTEQLTWKQGDRKIRSRRFVRITTPTERVRGNGLVADEDLSTYSIGRFTAKVDIEEETSADDAAKSAPSPSSPRPSVRPDTSFRPVPDSTR